MDLKQIASEPVRDTSIRAADVQLRQRVRIS
jgi:hypothetical protein